MLTLALCCRMADSTSKCIDTVNVFLQVQVAQEVLLQDVGGLAGL